MNSLIEIIRIDFSNITFIVPTCERAQWYLSSSQHLVPVNLVSFIDSSFDEKLVVRDSFELILEMMFCCLYWWNDYVGGK